MTTRDDYESATRLAYRNPLKANSYHRQQTEGVGWARFATWRELQCVKRALAHFAPRDHERLLDMPCGTGIIGRALADTAASIVAVDISAEMMALGAGAYAPHRMKGFVQADITSIPFPDGAFAGAVVLGFMHRVEPVIKDKALAELIRVSRDFLIVSFAVDGPAQRLKRAIAGRLFPGYQSAPAPLQPDELERLFRAHGLVVERMVRVAPVLSSEVVCWLTKPGAVRKS